MPKKEKIRIILRQLNGEATPEEKDFFSQWLLAKPENFDLFIEIKKLWETPMSRDLKFDDTKALMRINQATTRKRQINWHHYATRIAAIVIILVTIGSIAFHRFVKVQPENVITENIKLITKTSSPGEQLRITLPDASVAHLNAGSTICYPEKFTGHSRDINLIGEAFFEVTKDSLRPFIVSSANITTTVLGTSFNIKAFNDQNITVTVATGKVKVENMQEDMIGEIMLLPNEQASYNKNENRFTRQEVDARHYLAWTEGIIRFNNDDLQEVANMLERWYQVSIRLEVPRDEKIHIKGSYKDKKLYTILDGLSYMYNLSYAWQNENTILIKKETDMPPKNAYE
ncbi:FecR family protein [Gaoshiqia sediminis]|uniref:FecR domain-containing protein n=1 Tax=Gaoshiqia sediminis TaxID=2986998 RepID=A0AA41Y806_9BACT|nr:FecR domain-containing protein [Gaoshiqia sediminis]MCW0482827.1 FecR domain-containing protein [Gaoshiqia sediminis]